MILNRLKFEMYFFLTKGIRHHIFINLLLYTLFWKHRQNVLKYKHMLCLYRAEDNILSMKPKDYHVAKF